MFFIRNNILQFVVLVIALLSGLMISSCGTIQSTPFASGTTQSASSKKNTKAGITVRMMDDGAAFIHVDSKYVGYINRGGSQDIELSNGQHTVFIDKYGSVEASEILFINVDNDRHIVTVEIANGKFILKDGSAKSDGATQSSSSASSKKNTKAGIVIRRLDTHFLQGYIYIDGHADSNLIWAGGLVAIELPNGPHSILLRNYTFDCDPLFINVDNDRHFLTAELVNDKFILKEESAKPIGTDSNLLDIAITNTFNVLLQDIPQNSRIAIVNHCCPV